ncbi:PREDICTED: serine/threonine-protein kinase fray2-like [Vollenhovia emeryi]|uniref:serine/threonine-protein kinase fray2-like n=1 Tax=Vollenhovia emeryi TaxID=411798 RepID=UPI0005F3EDA6|nr:PREDICTED: serine/threonine-protein kinase fray2-like [Vollenhovia emeryi]
MKTRMILLIILISDTLARPRSEKESTVAEQSSKIAISDQIVETATGVGGIKGISVIIPVSSFPIIIIRAPRNFTTDDGQIIRLENGSTIIASTYNKTDVPGVLQMDKNETAQGTKESKFTQPQTQNLNNKTTDEYKSESQNMTGQIDTKQKGKDITNASTKCRISNAIRCEEKNITLNDHKKQHKENSPKGVTNDKRISSKEPQDKEKSRTTKIDKNASEKYKNEKNDDKVKDSKEIGDKIKDNRQKTKEDKEGSDSKPRNDKDRSKLVSEEGSVDDRKNTDVNGRNEVNETNKANKKAEGNKKDNVLQLDDNNKKLNKKADSITEAKEQNETGESKSGNKGTNSETVNIKQSIGEKEKNQKGNKEHLVGKDERDKNVETSQEKSNSVKTVTNKNQYEELEKMINNRTVLDKSVEPGHDSKKPLRNEEDNMEDMKKKNITRDSSLTDQEPTKINNTKNESIDKDSGNIKIDINGDRKNVMYFNKKMSSKLLLVTQLLLKTWRWPHVVLRWIMCKFFGFSINYVTYKSKIFSRCI